jgi:hypothetical protein
MSVQTAQEFLEFFNRDQPVKTQYNVADVDDMRELLIFAGQKGYKISEDDLRVALQTLPEDSPIRQLFRY